MRGGCPRREDSGFPCRLTQGLANGSRVIGVTGRTARHPQDGFRLWNSLGAGDGHQSGERDKADTLELFELYPFAKFKLVDNEVRMLGHTLPGFVDKCRQFQSRSIRTDIREARYLAVYLSSDATFKDAEKVVTANISPGGCFLYSAREWAFGSRVWLKFLGDSAVICGTVCSSRSWGNNKVLPGIGIRLDTSIAGSV